MEATVGVETADAGDGMKRRILRPIVAIIAIAFATFFGWVLWPGDPLISAHDLSREDGKSRFCATTFSQMGQPPNLTFAQRLTWKWVQFRRAHQKRNPAAYTFPASPVQPCSIHGLLSQCMEVTGTKYLIAVEIAGPIQFGTTNVLNGAQWVAAFERAVVTSDAVLCFDYARKSNFEDKLLFIRERPGLVKIVPRAKLSDYQKAGLVRNGSF